MSQQVEQFLLLTGGRDKFDAVIAFGYGSVQVGSQPGIYRLNWYGRINAIATGMLYQTLNISKL